MRKKWIEFSMYFPEAKVSKLTGWFDRFKERFSLGNVKGAGQVHFQLDKINRINKFLSFLKTRLEPSV